MTKPKRRTPKIRKLVVTTLGVLGYLSLLFQWLWVVALYLPLLLRSDLHDLFIPRPDTSQSTLHAIKIGGPDMLWLAIGIAVTAVVLIATIIILARLPMAIAKTGNKASETIAETALPIITHHNKIPLKQKRRLTARLVGYIKFCLALLPLAGLVGLWFTTFDLPNDIVVFVTLFFTLCTTVWFALQYLFATLLRVPSEDII